MFRKSGENAYNELGELIEKNLHSEDQGSTFSQSVDYRYNIRGWLTRINNSGLSDGEGDYFGMSLAYNEDFGTGNTPLYNGNISAAKWSDDFSGNQRLYNYSYDPMSRMTGANYKANKGAGWTDDIDKFNMSAGYDLNGNLESLTRNGMNGTMDQLTYTYTGNQLQTVEDLITEAEGFIDAHAGTLANPDFIYDQNGNMTVDKDKGLDSIAYNHLNKPQHMRRTDGSYLNFIYDANGIKLAQELYSDSDILKKRTDYIDEFIYENDTLKLIRHEEGRLVPDITGAWDYQYDLTDIWGNTMVSFTTHPKIHTFSTDYEGLGNDDQDLFEDVTTENNDLFDHTDAAGTTYTHAQRLNAAEGSRIGSVIAIPVGTGDVISAKVYAKYVDVPGSNTNAVTTLAASLIGAFTGSAGVTHEFGNSTVNNNFGSGSLIGGTGFPVENGSAPYAFLNMMFLPDGESINLVKDATFAYDQIDINATQQVGQPKNTNYDELSITNFTASDQGYILIYLSNENSTLVDVYFDDLEITVNEHPVIQQDNYYPFGKTYADGFQRVTTKKNNFLFHNKTEKIDDLDLGWYDFKYRMYNPELGRFFNIDPLAEDYYYNSPYAFAENKLGMGIELEGAELLPFSTHMSMNGPAGLFTFAADWVTDKIIGGGARMGKGALKYAQNEKSHSDYQKNGSDELPADVEQQIYETNKTDATAQIAEGMVDQLEGYTTLQGVAIGGVEGTLGSSTANTTKTVVKPNKSIYSALKDSKSVGPGKKFTAAQKRNMLNANRKANGGVLKSDMSGQVLDTPVQSRKGVPANMNQAEVDHKVARSKGGSNSYGNAQILSKTENLKKRDN